MALPTNVGTGRVTGRFILGVVDGADADQEPDAIPASGQISFTASVPYVPNPTAAPAPVTILKTTIIGVLDSDGYLCTPDPADPSKAGSRGIRLIATDDPDLSVQGWTWNVVYTFDTVNGARPSIQTHAIALPEGATVDLTTAVKVPSSTGIGVEQAEALAAAASLAALDAAESARQASEAAQATDEGVAVLVAGDGDTTAAIAHRFRRQFSVKEFGAVGDGVTDDTAAIRTAMNAGVPLYFGTDTDIYRVTSQLDVTASAPVVWRADGATILCDAPAPANRVISIEAAGHPVTVTGPFTVDGADTAFSGVVVTNDHDTHVPAALRDLRVQNCWRQSTVFTGGDGVWVRGAFNTVVIDSPVIRNIHMADAAHIQGSQGITGITVTAFTPERAPGNIDIISPLIDGVLCDNPENSNDQDGIRVFAASAPAGTETPFATKFTITGGTIRNSGGRAVKAQTEWGAVTGLHIIRDTERAQGISEIDFQVGGGLISQVSAMYANNTPRFFLRFGSALITGKTFPAGIVSGVSVITSGTQPISTLIKAEPRAAVNMNLQVRGVEVVGVQPTQVFALTGGAGAKLNATISGIMAAPTATLINGLAASSGSWSGDVVVSGCVNTGAPVPVYSSSAGASATPTIHADINPGFTV